jgi:3-dehydroquinate dehydratase-2
MAEISDLPELLGQGRLAMALVDAVPAGIYGKAALTSFFEVAGDHARALELIEQAVAMRPDNLDLKLRQAGLLCGADRWRDALDIGSFVDALDFEERWHEGEIVEMIHRARSEAQGIIINPGAYSHTSIAILDALNAFDGPVIEVHISNIHKRESFRHHSYVSLRADGVIAGLGTEGYQAALRRMATLLA